MRGLAIRGLRRLTRTLAIVGATTLAGASCSSSLPSTSGTGGVGRGKTGGDGGHSLFDGGTVDGAGVGGAGGGHGIVDGGGVDGGGVDGGRLDSGAPLPCLPSPTITGDLDPQWSFALGEGSIFRVRLDAHGNLLMAGFATGTLNTTTHLYETFLGPTIGAGASFLMALDPSGKMLWQRVLDVGWGGAHDFALDGAGNIYLVGTQSASGQTDLGDGPISGVVLLAKLDPRGKTIWSHGLEDFLDPSVDEVSPLAVTVDSTGQIAVAGYSYPNPSISQLPWSGFLAFYDQSGTYLGNLSAGTDAYPESVAFDGAGNLVVAGSFGGTLAWGPLTASTFDAFVTKFDQAHNVVWSFDLADDVQTSIALAVQGTTSYVVGPFGGSLTVGGATFVSQGVLDSYIATVDDGPPASTGLLARYAGASNSVNALAPDGSGGLWALASDAPVVDFGTGLNPSGDTVVLHLDQSGHTVTSGAFPINGSLRGSLAADAAGNVYLAGAFTQSLDLGGGVLVGPTSSDEIFVAKYSHAPAALSTRSCPPPVGGLLASNEWATPYPSMMALAGQSLAFSTGTETMTLPLVGGTPAVLATAQKYTAALAVQGGTIFWANEGSLGYGPPNGGSIVSVPVSGGTPKVLASGQSSPFAIAVDDQNVYWMTSARSAPTTQSGATGGGASGSAGTPPPQNASVWAIPIGGGTPLAIAGPYAYAGSLAAAGGAVVFAAGASPQAMQIMKVSPTGGDAAPIATPDQLVTSMAVDQGGVYWIGGDQKVWRTTLDGATSSSLTNPQPASFGLSAVAGTLYWCNAGINSRTGSGSTSANVAGVWSMPETGGNATAIASGLPGITRCAFDAAHLAWIVADWNNNWNLVVQAR